MPDDVVCDDHRPLASILCKGRDANTHENDVTERTRGEEQVDPGLDLSNLNVEPGRNNASLVQAAIQLNDNLARTVVVDNLKLANVSCNMAISTLVSSNVGMSEKSLISKVERCGLRSEPRSVNNMEMCYNG